MLYSKGEKSKNYVIYLAFYSFNVYEWNEIISKNLLWIEKKEIVLSTNKLFSARVGMCSISMVLDVRHSKDKADHPLSLCFSINRKRIYHSLGERYTHEELARIFYATGQGERKGDSETNFEKKQRLEGVFDSYVK